MFYGQLSEATKTDVPINEIESDIFWILLLCLYGESFENAMNDTLRKPSDFTNEEEYKDYHLSSLIDLLKTTDFYDAGFKDEVEDKIIDCNYIEVSNVCDILIHLNSNTCQSTRLKSYCKDYISKNRVIVINQLLRHRENENERLRVSQDLDKLLDE